MKNKAKVDQMTIVKLKAKLEAAMLGLEIISIKTAKQFSNATVAFLEFMATTPLAKIKGMDEDG